MGRDDRPVRRQRLGQAPAVHAQTPESLLAYPRWWIGGERRLAGARESSEAKAQGRSVVAKLAGCDDRDAGGALPGQAGRGAARGSFPQRATNEYYWADLIGLKVVNEQDEDLGTVSRVFETGANDVLVVQGRTKSERLIPFIERGREGSRSRAAV